MRRPFAVLVGIAVCVVVAGCGKSPLSATPRTNPPAGQVKIIHNDTQGGQVIENPSSNTTQSGHPSGPSVGTPTNDANGNTPGSSGSKVPSTSGANSVGTSPGTPAARPLSKQNPGPLTAVSFVTDKLGFVASQNGTIYQTLDGGNTWTPVYTAAEPVVGIQSTQETVQGQDNVMAWAWTKDTMLASFGASASTFFRAEFDGSRTPAMGRVPMEDVSMLPDGNVVFVSNGVVWAAGDSGSGWLKRTPPASVTSVAGVDNSTWYAATRTGVIYKTTDGGQSWTQVFAAPIKKGAPWQVQVQAIGRHVAAYFYGADAAMSQQAYVLYESNDAGQTWNALCDEAYFADYGNEEPLHQAVLSLQPGPFTLLTNGDILFAGVDPDHITETTFYVLQPNGSVLLSSPVGSPNTFSLDEMPTAMSSPDGQCIWLVGQNQSGKAVVEKSTDGGRNWQSSS